MQACLGGTLLEIAWSQGRVEECLRWAADAGVPLVEVSRGVMPMPLADKARLIARAARSFTVLTEVGIKDPGRQLDLGEWKDEVSQDLAAGAWLVITEGRESGTVGTYDASGAVIEEVIDAVVGVAGHERILFEAPRRHQQAWCINRFGPDVNLGNVALDDIVNLEALRLGLRADTAVIASGPAATGTGTDVSTRVADSLAYRHLWTAPELDRLFEERDRLQRWLDILAALARAQASLGIIATESARVITEHADAGRLDLERIAAETRRTGHSTLGLIHELQRIVPAPAREHVYYGATVQDLTDTWFGLVLRDVGTLVGDKLWALEGSLLELAATHRDTVMVGRTHGQPGAAITFGFKVAGWADELRRHQDRLRGGTPALGGRPARRRRRSAGLLRRMTASNCAAGSAPSSAWMTRASPG